MSLHIQRMLRQDLSFYGVGGPFLDPIPLKTMNTEKATQAHIY